MMKNSQDLKVYAVTDRSWLNGRTLSQVCEEVLAGGATILQLREKHLERNAFLAEALELQALCRRFNVPLIINDDVSIAKEIGAGVHIGQGDLALKEARRQLGPEAIIGISCQTVSQALEAEANGADYLGVGAVFPTSTKLDADYVDNRELTAICQAVKIPVVAIGGISHGNVRELAGSGIVGVAVVSALFAASDPRQATSELDALMNDVLATPVNRIPGAIVDMDGTILDSLKYWDTLASDFLADRGLVAEPGLRQKLNALEVPLSAIYLKEHYALPGTVEEIRDGLFQAIRFVYTTKAGLMPGARELLEQLHGSGIRIALFTASLKEDAETAMRRNGVLQYFDCILNTADAGYTKSDPRAFLYALGRLGTALADTTIYEDADYAIEGAGKTGMRIVTPDQFAR